MSTASGHRLLCDRVAVVTGASQGIGAAITIALAGEGALVVAAARNEPKLAGVIDHIHSAGGTAVALTVDVVREDSVRNLLHRIESDYGRLNIAVNNAAGGGRRPAPLMEWSSAEFDNSISVNLRGTFLCMKYELELMQKTVGDRAIVNMSSTAGEQGVAGLSGYVASKYGIGGLTRVAALDYASTGIRVNALAPGPILTQRLAAASEAARSQVAETVPLGRIGRVEEVATAALWLCSEQSSFITGAVINIDGGRLAGTPAFVR